MRVPRRGDGRRHGSARVHRLYASALAPRIKLIPALLPPLRFFSLRSPQLLPSPHIQHYPLPQPMHARPTLALLFALPPCLSLYSLFRSFTLAITHNAQYVRFFPVYLVWSPFFYILSLTAAFTIVRVSNFVAIFSRSAVRNAHLQYATQTLDAHRRCGEFNTTSV
jgi:hypothetical protein